MRNALSARLEANLEAVMDDMLKAPPRVGDRLRQDLEDIAIATQNARSTNNPPAIISQPAATVHLVPASALHAPSLNPETVNAARRLLRPPEELRPKDDLDHTQ